MCALRKAGLSARQTREETASRRASSRGSAASASSWLSCAEGNEMVAMAHLPRNVTYESRIALEDVERIPQMSDL